MADSTKKRRKRSKLGSKREVKPGVWEIRVSCGYTKHGKQRRVQRTVHGTEKQAEIALVRLADEMGRSISLGDSMTLDHYFWAYFIPSREASTTKANVKTLKSHYRNHIEPFFGDWDIATIDDTEVQRWLYRLPPKSAHLYRKSLSAIVNQAFYDHVIDKTPMPPGRVFKMPRIGRREPLPVWGVLDVVLCFERLEGDGLYPLWLCMVGCGLSRSEALALDWEQIEWASMRDADGVEHWAAAVPVVAACTPEDGMKEPKNPRRWRMVPMRPVFADRLHACIGEGPICKGRGGKRQNPKTLCYRWRRLFGEGMPLEGLPYVGINRMRATYSTLMQQAGVDWTIINTLQGRAQTSNVLYTNYLVPPSATLDGSTAKLERLLVDGTQSPLASTS